MDKLVGSRPLFHSETDFQHAFAWEFHRFARAWDVRLEVPIRTGVVSIYLDFLARSANAEVAIELKYKTRALDTTISGERFRLKNQAAQDIGRYDFFKDLNRVEKYVQSDKQRRGFAIFLTNDSAYWKAPARSGHAYSEFAMNENREISGSLEWGETVSAGTRRGRDETITILHQYRLQWRAYSSVAVKHYGDFRYLCVEAQAG